MMKRQPPPGISTEDWGVTPESVQTMVYRLMTVVDELQQIVPHLEKRISQLEEQVGKNSHNLSMPPSSDPPQLKQPPPPMKGKRKQGGQPGHKGHGCGLRPTDEVTRFVVSKPACCQQCGTLLLGKTHNHSDIRSANCRQLSQRLSSIRFTPCAVCTVVSRTVPIGRSGCQGVVLALEYKP